ncbi:hypothetical protein [Devosia sp.]|uniref:hypothetical protein n=1 Tax=Devosia sp. TaxID=1871048 RepID=UPI00292F1318|nr:hypothetical protein [Devosia sp.]
MADNDDELPSLRSSLGLVITKGVALCNHCTVDDAGAPLLDLRDFPQPLIEEDLEAPDFVTALVDPDPVRSSFQPTLHDDLTGMDRSELFKMMMTGIATAIMANGDPRTQPSDTRTNRGMTRFIDAGPLARAGRALMNWPSSFADLLVEASDGKDRRDAQWGRLKELGALGVLPRNDFMPASAKALLAAQVDRFFVMTPVARNAVRKGGTRDPELYIGARELKKATGVDNRLVTALSLCDGIVTYRTAPPPAPLVFVATR